MKGVFVCIVGPSGAGKDTLIDGARHSLADDPLFVFPRRLVTRQSSSAEDHDTLAMAEFQRLQERGAFALSWTAHGLGYAIPASALTDVDAGRVVVSNLSRSAIADARERFPALSVVLITAPRATVRDRLLARGREAASLVEARLDREERQAMPDADLVIDNVGPVEANIDRLAAYLKALASEVAPR